MNGGPFKLPTKENADAAKKKRVRRGCAPRTSRRPNPSPLLIESHLTSTPFPVHHSRRRSPGSRSGSSLASRISTSRIARVSSTSRRCAPRYPLSSVPLCPVWMTHLDRRAADRSIETRRLTGNRPTRTTPTPADRMRRPRLRPHRHRGANHLRGEGGRSGWHGVCVSVRSRRADERGSRRAHAPGVDLRGLVRG